MDENLFERVHVVHSQWSGELWLEKQGNKVVHAAHPSKGYYRRERDRLIVSWDSFPPDSFILTRGAFLDERIAVNIPELKKLRFVEVSGRTIPCTRVYLRTPKEGYEVCLRLETTDSTVFEQIFLYEEYASPHLPTHARTIVDLGANIGMSTIFFALRYPEAGIIAVEPDFHNFEILKANVANLGERAKVEHAAAWAHDGQISLVLQDTHGRALEAWGVQVSESSQSETTRTARIPSYCMETVFEKAGFGEIDILKVDVEGAEKEIFLADPSRWLPRVKFVVIETHERFKPGSEKAVLDALRDDFERLPMSGENLIFKRRETQA